MKTIIILDYITAETHIVYTNRKINNIEEYLTEEMNFNLGDIDDMHDIIDNLEGRIVCQNS